MTMVLVSNDCLRPVAKHVFSFISAHLHVFPYMLLSLLDTLSCIRIREKNNHKKNIFIYKDCATKTKSLRFVSDSTMPELYVKKLGKMLLSHLGTILFVVVLVGGAGMTMVLVSNDCLRPVAKHVFSFISAHLHVFPYMLLSLLDTLSCIRIREKNNHKKNIFIYKDCATKTKSLRFVSDSTMPELYVKKLGKMLLSHLGTILFVVVLVGGAGVVVVDGRMVRRAM